MSSRSNGEGTIYKRSDGRWCAQIYRTEATGVRRRKTLYGTSKAQVHQKLIQAQENERKHIPAPAKSWTVGSWLDYWLTNIVTAKTRAATHSSYEMHVRLYLKPMFGRIPLQDLSVQTVQDGLDALSQRSRGVTTAYMCRATLAAALVHAMRREIVHRNVAKIALISRVPRKPFTPWTADQVQHFLAGIKNHRLYGAYLLLCTYGLRKGEVMGLRWADIDFEHGQIHVRQQIQHIDNEPVAVAVKTDTGNRALPLVPAVHDYLIHRLRQRTVNTATIPTDGGFDASDLVFTEDGGPLKTNTLLYHLTRLAKQLGLPHTTVHGLRHMAATLLKDLGVPAKDIQAILGHAHISTTQQIYQHGSPAIQRSAITAIEQAIIQEPHRAAYGTRCSQNRSQNLKSRPSDALGVLLNCEQTTEVRASRRPLLDGANGALIENSMITSTPLLSPLTTSVIRDALTTTMASILAHIAVETAVKSHPCHADHHAVHAQYRTELRSRQARQLFPASPR